MPLSLVIGRFLETPDEVTGILDLHPTRTVRVGELLPSGRASSINSWELTLSDVTIANGADHHKSLKQLIDAVRGRENAFRAMRDRLKPELMSIVGEIIFPFNWSRGEQGVWMDARDMQILADCGLAWGVDVFQAD